MAFTSFSLTMHLEKNSSSFFILHTFSTHISLKFDDYNFFIWQQILAIIKGLKLLKFLAYQNLPPKYNTPEDLTAIF